MQTQFFFRDSLSRPKPNSPNPPQHNTTPLCYPRVALSLPSFFAVPGCANTQPQPAAAALPARLREAVPAAGVCVRRRAAPLQRGHVRVRRGAAGAAVPRARRAGRGAGGVRAGRRLAEVWLALPARAAFGATGRRAAGRGHGRGGAGRGARRGRGGGGGCDDGAGRLAKEFGCSSILLQLYHSQRRSR